MWMSHRGSESRMFSSQRGIPQWLDARRVFHPVRDARSIFLLWRGSLRRSSQPKIQAGVEATHSEELDNSKESRARRSFPDQPRQSKKRGEPIFLSQHNQPAMFPSQSSRYETTTRTTGWRETPVCAIPQHHLLICLACIRQRVNRRGCTQKRVCGRLMRLGSPTGPAGGSGLGIPPLSLCGPRIGLVGAVRCATRMET